MLHLLYILKHKKFLHNLKKKKKELKIRIISIIKIYFKFFINIYLYKKKNFQIKSIFFNEFLSLSAC
jgi:hypothetical protein